VDHDRVRDAIGLIYDAALDSSLWMHALGGLTELFGASGCSLFLIRKQSLSVPLSYFQGLPENAQVEYSARYSTLEPGMPFIFAHPHTPIVTDLMWIDERGIDVDEFYDWLERKVGIRYRLGAQIVNTADLCGLAALQYPKRHGPPTESEIKLLEMLLPHLRRAVRISSEMSELKNGFRAAHDLLNALSVGVILLNRAGRAMFLNRMAEDIVAGSDGFSLDRSGCPRAARPQEARDLARAIADAARSLGSPDVSPGGALRVTRTSGLQPFEILVSPVSDGREALGLGESPTVMLFLVDPERRPELPSVPLQRLFGLTPAEARLVSVLARSGSCKCAAESLGIAESTARQVLKTVFRKTNTHSQSDLLRLVLESPVARVRPATSGSRTQRRARAR
jgi:DNA-binding CsgD family transcriptional regulator